MKEKGTTARTPGPGEEGQGEQRVPGQVAELLEAGNAQEALRLTRHSKLASSWVTNATAVCLLRLGKAEEVINLLRPQVLSGGIQLRTDVPLELKINLAAALLLTGNVHGCLSILDELEADTHPAVADLRACVRRWVGSLGFWQRLSWWLGGEPSHPVEGPARPGVLMPIPPGKSAP